MNDKAPSDMTREELLNLCVTHQEIIRNQSNGVVELYSEIKDLKDENEQLKLINRALAFAYGHCLKVKEK